MTCPIPNEITQAQEAVFGRALKEYERLKQDEDTLRDAVQERATASGMAEGARRRNAKEVTAAIRARDDAVTAAGGAVADAERELARVRERAHALEERGEAAAVERARAQRALDMAPGRVDVADVARQVVTLEAMLADLDARIARKEQARALTDEILASEEAKARATQDLALFRTLQAAAKGTVAALLGRALAPLVNSVTGLLGRVLPGWRLVAVAEAGGVEFLAATGGPAPTAWGALSGSQQVVFSAALSLALVRLQAPPARFLMLEAAELDAARLVELMDALTVMGEDFHSILLASCHAPADMPAGWDCINAGRLAPALDQAVS